MDRPEAPCPCRTWGASHVVSTIPAPRGLVGAEDGPTDVVVVCVTYNSSAVIEAFLSALPAALGTVQRCRVVVADNDSCDTTPELVRALAPWVDLVQTGRNGGYAAAINAALRHCPPRVGAYVLNPDTIPAPGSVAVLLDTIRSDDAVGIAVPRMLGADGSLQFSLRREPTIRRALGEALVGGSRTSRMPMWGETVGDPAAYARRSVADWATGAAMFITRAAMDDAGEWDERFFLYSEETDFALRVRDSGRLLVLQPAARVVHQGGDQATSPTLWAISAVNRTRMYRKRHGLAPSLLYWCAVTLNEGVRAATGSRTHRAGLAALLAAGPNLSSSDPTPQLLHAAGHHR